MMKILLVEDSLILRDRLSTIISAIPNAALVAETNNVEDARSYLEKYRPDVAVIDLQLKCSSGLSVIEHIRGEYLETTVIVLTNLAQPEYRIKCMELGAHYFFDKSKCIDAFTNLLADLSKSSAKLIGLDG